MEHIAIVGRSKVGLSLAAAIRRSKRMKLACVIPARDAKYPAIDADVLIIATKDDVTAMTAIKALHTCKTPPKIMLHLAGSQSPNVLPDVSGMSRLTLHPIQTFPKPDVKLLSGIYWMASSENSKAIAWAKKFVRALGGKGIIVLKPDELPLYHAMTVFSANFITLLGEAIEEMSTTLGQNPKRMKAALTPLMERALSNALQKPAAEVLTGPFKRKDFDTIKKHQSALQKTSPNLRKIYDAFLNYAVRP